MTIRQLVVLLQTFPADTQVEVSDTFGNYHPIQEKDIFTWVKDEPFTETEVQNIVRISL